MTTQPQPDAGLREALLYVQAALNWGVFNQNPSVASSNEMRDIKEVVRLALRSTPAAPQPDARPTGDTALLTLQERLGIAGLTQSVAIVVHRWKHPTYALGEQGCRCAKDAASAVDVSLSEGLVSSPATPPALDAALERVESEHRRGDWTEDGFVGNSIDGLECLVCGSGWPCAAQALRAAIKGDASSPKPSKETGGTE